MVDTVQLTSLVGYQSFEEFLVREGEPASWVNANAGGAIAAGTGTVNVAIATAQGPALIGKAVLIEEISASLSAPGIAQIQIAASADTRFPGFLKQAVITATAVSFKVNLMVRGLLNGNSNVTLNVRNNMTAGSVDYYGAVSASGYRITDDLDLSAPKVVMFAGDSLLNGTGPTKTATMWAFLFKKKLRDLGTRARVCLKTVSGSTTGEHEAMRAAGYHDIAKVDLGVYALGVNDAGAAVADATYLVNLTAYWEWFSKRYPLATLVVCGVPPLENNTSETRAAGLRTTASTYVASIASPRLRYINFGTAFDRTVSSNYVGTDTPGSRVHPNDTGHGAMATLFNAAWEAFGITI